MKNASKLGNFSPVSSNASVCFTSAGSEGRNCEFFEENIHDKRGLKLSWKKMPWDNG